MVLLHLEGTSLSAVSSGDLVTPQQKMVPISTTSADQDIPDSNAHSATQASTVAALGTLLSSLSGAKASLPSNLKETRGEHHADTITIIPPEDVFLILFQLREKTGKVPKAETFVQDVIHKLVELRAYLDRGVKPLEARLKYQIDKVAKAAEDATRSQKDGRSETEKKKTNKVKIGTGRADGDKENPDLVGSEDGETNDDNDEDDEDDEDSEIDEMAYRPNISAFTRNMASNGHRGQSGRKTITRSSSSTADGIYRPPKIKAIAPPTSLTTTDRNHPSNRDRDRRHLKSSVIDEFVAAEMSSAPTAEPSIGSTIQRGGRRTISQKEREKEHERRVYEETNFVRLPKENKKEQSKQRRLAGGRDGGFGGEEFRMLTEGADRIGRLTGRLSGRKSSGSLALERSRKRRLTEDGARGNGTNGIGQSFEKRRRRVERRA